MTGRTQGKASHSYDLLLPQGSRGPTDVWDKITGLEGTWRMQLLLTGSRPAHLELVATMLCTPIDTWRGEKGGDRCLGSSHNNTNDNDDDHLSCGQAVNGTHSTPVPGCAGGGGKGHRSQMTGEMGSYLLLHVALSRNIRLHRLCIASVDCQTHTPIL